MKTAIIIAYVWLTLLTIGSAVGFGYFYLREEVIFGELDYYRPVWQKAGTTTVISSTLDCTYPKRCQFNKDGTVIQIE